MKGHLLPTFQRWNDDGTRNDIVEETTTTTTHDSNSDSSSQTSNIYRDLSLALILSQEQTESTPSSTHEIDDEESSSQNATSGSTATVHSVELINDEDPVKNKNNNPTHPSQLQANFPTRKRRHSRTPSSNSGNPFPPSFTPSPNTNRIPTDFKNDFYQQETKPPVRTSSTHLLVLTAVLSLVTLYLAIYIFKLVREGKDTSKPTKFCFLLSTRLCGLCF